jgi:hypothetical protein
MIWRLTRLRKSFTTEDTEETRRNTEAVEIAQEFLWVNSTPTNFEHGDAELSWCAVEPYMREARLSLGATT